MKRFLRMIFTVCVLACTLIMSISAYAKTEGTGTKTEAEAKPTPTIKGTEAFGSVPKNEIILKKKITEKTKALKVSEDNIYNSCLTIKTEDVKTIEKSKYTGPIFNYGTLTIKGGTVNGTIFNFGTLEITGGVFPEKNLTRLKYVKGKTEEKVTGPSIINCTKDAKLEITGGEIRGGLWNFGEANIKAKKQRGVIFARKNKKNDQRDTIVNYKYGKLTILSGTFINKPKNTDKNICLIRNYGEVVLGDKADSENKAIQSTGFVFNCGYMEVKSGTFKGYQKWLLFRNDGQMKITGGIFESNTHVVFHNANKYKRAEKNFKQGQLLIKGGMFTSKAGSGNYFALSNNGGNAKVTGGTFIAHSKTVTSGIGSTSKMKVNKAKVKVYITKDKKPAEEPYERLG